MRSRPYVFSKASLGGNRLLRMREESDEHSPIFFLNWPPFSYGVEVDRLAHDAAIEGGFT